MIKMICQWIIVYWFALMIYNVDQLAIAEPDKKIYGIIGIIGIILAFLIAGGAGCFSNLFHI